MSVLVVAWAIVACERRSAVVRHDAGAGLQAGIVTRPVEVSIRPVEIKGWGEAPAACSAQPAHASVRSETAAATTAFLRWVALTVDPSQDAAGRPGYLQDVRAMAAEGWTAKLVPPAAFAMAWAGDARLASSEEQASHAAANVVTVEFVLRGTVERGSGASPVIGELWTTLFQHSRSSGNFGAFVQVCVMPPVDGVAPVYLLLRSVS